MPGIEIEVQQFITDNFLFDNRPIRDTDSFLELGIIDSIGILQLINFVQQRYGIELEDSELVPENLDCIRNLASLVRTKLSEKHTTTRYTRLALATVLAATSIITVHSRTRGLRTATHVSSITPARVASWKPGERPEVDREYSYCNVNSPSIRF